MTAVNWDVVVIGAGAAGLMAATHAAGRGRRTLLLEKTRRPGVKILMSGGTRCNITHDCDERAVVAAFGKNGKFLHSPLACLGVRGVIALFEAEGVATKIEETGKVFPVSNKATDVLDALVRRLNRAGAALALEEPALDVSPREGGGFTVVTPKRQIGTASVVVTTGGKSYPGSGTTGDGYALAAKFGHTIVPTRPALTPLTVAADWVPGLRGLTIPDTVLRVLPAAGGKPLDSRRGSLLFAHFGLSGPVALDASGAVSGHPEPASLALEIDFLPAIAEPAYDEAVRTHTTAAGKQLLAVVLSADLPRRLCDALVSRTGLPLDRRAAALSRAERAGLVAAVKRQRLPLRGTLGYEKAEVTAGGVALDEVDSRTMQSKRQPGLYFAGEVLDLDGPIGGYNFQAAWSTGWLAGRGA
jgi:predicted Rossmann fold flavoprotein